MNKHTIIRAANTANHLKHPGLPGRPPRHTRKTLMLLAGGAAVLLLAGCGGKPITTPVPDLVPVGEGLRVIGYALVAAAVVLTFGKILR